MDQNAIIHFSRGCLLCVIWIEALCYGFDELMFNTRVLPVRGLGVLAENTPGNPPAKDFLACRDCIELLP
ncbi:hypothetical protein [Pseudomonas sp. GM55]|jgi:hypothetical protein|uniref:hypothetical protein n=1 Tax=Pseudomonas sp. GM55 TaxID=1144333 RepID=UPI00138AED33|nr:hypothetical protein [Pseudomonas sp. GM55]